LSARRRAFITKVTIPVVKPVMMLLGLQQLQALPNLSSVHIQRKISVRFLDISGWAVMAPQIITEVKGMPKLTEVKFLTPEASSLAEHEYARKARLEEIDLRISDAASNREVLAGSRN
jgi:hypothetical protein